MKRKSVRWPREGDTELFKGGFDLDLNADISHWNKDMYSYANGYRQAADLLVQRIVRSKRTYSQDVSYLVFPIVFLYRHYIEFRLKEIIGIGSRLYSKTPQDFPTHHKIEKLWLDARPFLEKLSAEAKEDLDRTEKYVKHLWAIDPKSYAFRYPADKKRKQLISNDWMVIDLRHFGKVMGSIGYVLDSSVEGLYVYLQEASALDGEW